MPDSAFHRRLPIGAEPVDFRTSHVRLWAPRPRRVEVITVPGTRTSLTREDGGYFSGKTVDVERTLSGVDRGTADGVRVGHPVLSLCGPGEEGGVTPP